jgi:hypothetical protein
MSKLPRRIKLADLAKPEPIEFEGPDGSVAFVMPRRLTNLSKVERQEYERLAREQHAAALTLLDHFHSESSEDADGKDEKAKALASAAEDAQFRLVEKVLPGLTREQFDNFSPADVTAIVELFVSGPLDPGTGDPGTSG